MCDYSEMAMTSNSIGAAVMADAGSECGNLGRHQLPPDWLSHKGIVVMAGDAALKVVTQSGRWVEL